MSSTTSEQTEANAIDAVNDGVVQVLEFKLGDGRYCMDIDCIDEIVDAGTLTPIPKSASHVEGVMDLRGRTTTIVNPNTVFDNGQDGEQNRIIVLDSDSTASDSTLGWIVDEVHQVRTITPDLVDEPTTATDEHVIGVVKSDDSFVVWVSPEIATDRNLTVSDQSDR